MANRNDFPGLLVSKPGDFDKDIQNAPFGADASQQIYNPLMDVPMQVVMPQPAGQQLSWAESNIAPGLGSLFDATGLSSNAVQNVASQMATPFRDAANWLSPDLGNSIWPQSTAGNGASDNPAPSTDTSHTIYNSVMDMPMQVVMPKALTAATQVNMPNVVPTQARDGFEFSGIKNADSMSRHGTYTQDEANNIINLEKNGANTSYSNAPPMSEADKDSVIKYSNAAQLDPHTMFKFISMESGGNPNAISPNGAIGDFQFTGGTANGDKATPTTPERFRISNRFDPDQNIMAGVYRAKQNAEALNKANLPISAENLYMMHQLGPITGVKVLNGAQNNTPVTQLSHAAQNAMGMNVGKNSTTAQGYVNANKQMLDARYKNFLKQNPDLE